MASVNRFPRRSHPPSVGIASPLNISVVFSSKSWIIVMKSSHSVREAKHSASFPARSAIAPHRRILSSQTAFAASSARMPSSSVGSACAFMNS